MHPESERLFSEWRNTFWSADHDILWLASEKEYWIELAPNIVLVGRVDAEGVTGDGRHFFGEWKTMSAYRGKRMDEEKAKWQTDPQALTYGVLLQDKASRFMVRWAIKSTPAKCDFEWYQFTAGELNHWRSEIIDIATEIRANRRREHMRTNFGNCYQYGLKYACPFLNFCTRQKWDESAGKPRTPHLIVERPDNALDRTMLSPDTVVIDASRIGDYLECPEKYRRKWEGEGYQEESEALTVGTDFHSLVRDHINTLIGVK